MAFFCNVYIDSKKDLLQKDLAIYSWQDCQSPAITGSKNKNSPAKSENPWQFLDRKTAEAAW